MKKFGIDISRWQGNFDFAKAKNEGVKFAILKAAGSDGGLYVDPMFYRNYNEAKRLGIPVGVYFFSNALSVAEAKRDAEYLITNCLAGRQFEYPIFLDVETEAQQKLGKAKVDAIVTAFCDALIKAGYCAGFYCNAWFYRDSCNGLILSKKYKTWIASWTASQPDIKCDMWQYGGDYNKIRDTHVAGVVCDQNYCFVDFLPEIKSKGQNGYLNAEKAIKKLSDRGVISNPSYWKKHVKDVKYLDELFIKVANSI